MYRAARFIREINRAYSIYLRYVKGSHFPPSFPKEAKVTYDMLQQLALRGQHGVAADLLDRMTYDGDTGMTSKIEAYLNGDKSAIEAAHPYTVGLKDGSRAKLSTAQQRIGTAFDPGNSAFDSNYRMQFPDGSEVPVLGHDAYGGKVNRFGRGEFTGNELEKRLAVLAEAHSTNGDTELARKAYLDESTKTVYG